MSGPLRMGPWLLLLALASGGCPKGQEGLPPGEVEALQAPAGGCSLLFRLEDDRPRKLRAVANMVHKRLTAFGLSEVRVEALPPQSLRVVLSRGGAAAARRAVDLITKPVAMAITTVDPGRRYFEDLAAQLPAGVRVSSDRLGDLAHGKTRRIWYLLAEQRRALERQLDRLQPPAGRRLVPLWGERGGMTLLVQHPPVIENPILKRVHLRRDAATGQLSVQAELARPYSYPFRRLAYDQLNRPLAFVAAGEVIALPVIADKPPKGRLRIVPSPLASEAQARAQAERLAVRLKSWGLAGSLRPVARRCAPP